MAAQKTARASPELRKGSTQPALPSDLHHHPGHKLLLKTEDQRNRPIGTACCVRVVSAKRRH